LVTKTSDTYQAQLTFAMARHAAVDLALVLKPGRCWSAGSLPSGSSPANGSRTAATIGNYVGDRPDLHSNCGIAAMYEPFLNALAERFL